jgi:hypothetical protein
MAIELDYRNFDRELGGILESIGNLPRNGSKELTIKPFGSIFITQEGLPGLPIFKIHRIIETDENESYTSQYNDALEQEARYRMGNTLRITQSDYSNIIRRFLKSLTEISKPQEGGKRRNKRPRKTKKSKRVKRRYTRSR